MFKNEREDLSFASNLVSNLNCDSLEEKLSQVRFKVISTICFIIIMCAGKIIH